MADKVVINSNEYYRRGGISPENKKGDERLRYDEDGRGSWYEIYDGIGWVQLNRGTSREDIDTIKRAVIEAQGGGGEFPLPITIPDISDKELQNVFTTAYHRQPDIQLSIIYETLRPIHECSTLIKHFYAAAWDEIKESRRRGSLSDIGGKYQDYWRDNSPFFKLDRLFVKLGSCMPSLEFLTKVKELTESVRRSRVSTDSTALVRISPLVEVGGGNGFNCALFRLALQDKNIKCLSYDIQKVSESSGISHSDLIRADVLGIIPPINSDGIKGITDNDPDILLICWAHNINMITQSLEVFKGDTFILLHCDQYAPVGISTLQLCQSIREMGFSETYREEEWFSSGAKFGPKENIHYSRGVERHPMPNNFCSIFTRDGATDPGGPSRGGNIPSRRSYKKKRRKSSEKKRKSKKKKKKTKRRRTKRR